MKFLTSLILLSAAALSSALPTTSKRAAVHVAPNSLCKTYEHSPNTPFGPTTWGETSRVGGGLTGVNTLISFQLDAAYGGATCNLRFADAEVHTGSNTFSVFSFVPTNGVTFDPNTATWNQKTGYRDQQLATFQYGASGDLVYSFTCPTGGKLLNYELTSANGDSNLQWDTSLEQGLWLEVVSGGVEKRAAPVPIPYYDQCQLHEAAPNTAFGSSVSGVSSQYSSGHIITTLVAFVMPTGKDLSTRTCSVEFVNGFATGSKSFALFEFVPNQGKTFKSALATWNSRTGYRNNQLATYKVGSSVGPVYKFPCPGPGKAVNFEVVPTNGDVYIAWTKPAGGLTLKAL
ncbi:hypothetical protein FN846DRAFT_903060 [Sphaerosporella brunnea]|uniref:Ubiquitin 3 binding protein But2 C-terminal domain-containing protein n=1 Tax=Sphaerosporella brunnea TaxID=1250544 RepID=A0A5J5F8T1_9PEZI|nr:hypothetical protein FN846DRAFT_903060 [Sphaerosporella brunnea]